MIERPNWALVLVGLADWIEGATRIQKYAFLGAKTIKNITTHGFYDDWMASKYGPFSPSLAEDINALVKAGLVGRYSIKNEFGYKVDRFALTETGKTKFASLKSEFQQYDSGLREIVNRYNKKSLMDVLHDVYYQFPQYAMTSSIKPKVAKKIYESDSYLNTQMDEPEPDE